MRRGCFVICKVVVPYVIDHLSKQQILLHLYPAPLRIDPPPDRQEADSAFIQVGQYVLTQWTALREWCQRNADNIQYPLIHRPSMDWHRQSVEWVKRCQMALFYVFGSYYLVSHSLSRIKLFHIDGKYHSVPQYYLLGVFLLLQLLVTTVMEQDRWKGDASSALPVPILEADGCLVEPRAESSEDAVVGPQFASKCPLCLGRCVDATSAACGHVFCWKCIGEWVQEKEECPLCRTDTKLHHLVPIYHADF